MDWHLVRIRDNGLEIPQYLALRQHRAVFGIEHVKPI